MGENDRNGLEGAVDAVVSADAGGAVSEQKFEEMNSSEGDASHSDGLPAEVWEAGDEVGIDSAAPTPEEAFLLQVLSPEDLAALRAKQQAAEIAEEEEEDLSPEERQAKAEHDALAAAFAMVRRRSDAGKLTTPGTWAAEGLVPDHLLPVDFCDIAFDTIIAAQVESAERAQAAAEAEAASGAAQGEGAADSDAADEDAMPDGRTGTDDASAQDENAASVGGVAKAEATEPGSDAGATDAAVPEIDEEPQWQLDDIKVLEGKQTYLYSSDCMTDTYAHWAFLAEEGDDALTLVDNARTESRLYPRPMLASSLSNKPYYWDGDKIAAAWQAVQESGAYPDIQTCEASNGDQYFYSTDYLSTAQAKALAEWYSVERCRNV